MVSLMLDDLFREVGAKPCEKKAAFYGGLARCDRRLYAPKLEYMSIFILSSLLGAVNINENNTETRRFPAEREEGFEVSAPNFLI